MQSNPQSQASKQEDAQVKEDIAVTKVREMSAAESKEVIYFNICDM